MTNTPPENRAARLAFRNFHFTTAKLHLAGQVFTVKDGLSRFSRATFLPKHR